MLSKSSSLTALALWAMSLLVSSGHRCKLSFDCAVNQYILLTGSCYLIFSSHRAATEKAKAAHAEEQRTGVRSAHKGSVANLSLGGGKSKALDQGINAAVDHGLHIAVAAGNDNKDACNYSPAAAENAVTVGASTLQDTRAYFSNWGKCVDVFGPGELVVAVRLYYWKGMLILNR